MSSVVVVSSLTIAPSVVLLSSYNHIRKTAVFETAAVDEHLCYFLSWNLALIIVCLSG